MSTMQRPTETAADVTKLLSEQYCLQSTTITELVSFDSRNFALEAVSLPSHNHMKVPASEGDSCNEEDSPDKFVLKIFNSWLSSAERLPTTRQQIRCSEYLRQRGFRCPKIIRTRSGELFARTPSDCYAMLMERLPGQQLGADKTKETPSVLYELGVFLASMHQTLKDCDTQHLETDPGNPWSQENMHLLPDYLHCIQSEENREILGRVIAKFQWIRSDKFHLLQKGIIHGDFHDFNLIVDWSAADSGTSQDFESLQSQDTTPPSLPLESQQQSILLKYGLIDFEEMSLSYPVLELSRLIADMMIGCPGVDLFDVGGHIIAGYTSIDNSALKHFTFCLYETALACLAQYVVLSTHEYQIQEESNEYCLLDSPQAMAILRRTKDTETATVYKAWGEVLTSYGLENLFVK